MCFESLILCQFSACSVTKWTTYVSNAVGLGSGISSVDLENLMEVTDLAEQGVVAILGVAGWRA